MKKERDIENDRVASHENVSPNYQQKVQNMIRLLLQEKSDQVLYCLHMNFCPSNYAFNGSVSTLYQVFYFFSKSYLFHKTLFMVTLYKTI